MRLFVASRIDETAARRIDQGLASAKARTSRATWVQPHAYHLTYAFLGEQDESARSRVAAALPADLAGLQAYAGVLSGGGFFPNDRGPRVGWLAIESPGALHAVADAVRRMLEGLAIRYDRKAFRPHLTVVRIRDRWGARDVAEFRKACEAIGRIDLTIDRVSLFRSELRPEGARHEEIAGVALD